MDKKKNHASQSSTLPSRSKNPPPKPKLVNKLARPTAQKKKSSVANKSSYAIAAVPASVGKEIVNLKCNFQIKNNLNNAATAHS